MAINPWNVLRILESKFPTRPGTLSEPTEAETELAEKLASTLKSYLESDEYFCEIKEELDSDLDNSRYEETVAEDKNISRESERDEEISPTSPSSSTSYEALPMEIVKPEPTMHQKRKVVEFWKSGKRAPMKLETVQHNFRFVKSRQQLYRYEKQIMEAGTLKDKYKAIREGVLSRYKAANEERLVVHDRDLRRWALEENERLEQSIPNFKATSGWLWKWKRSNKIGMREMTKVVSEDISLRNTSQKSP